MDCLANPIINLVCKAKRESRIQESWTEISDLTKTMEDSRQQASVEIMIKMVDRQRLELRVRKRTRGNLDHDTRCSHLIMTMDIFTY